jgi:hypothetical protein
MTLLLRGHVWQLEVSAKLVTHLLHASLAADGLAQDEDRTLAGMSDAGTALPEWRWRPGSSRQQNATAAVGSSTTTPPPPRGRPHGAWPHHAAGRSCPAGLCLSGGRIGTDGRLTEHEVAVR